MLSDLDKPTSYLLFDAARSEIVMRPVLTQAVRFRAANARLRTLRLGTHASQSLNQVFCINNLALVSCFGSESASQEHWLWHSSKSKRRAMKLA
jgi:hypothetical protein